MIHCSPSQLQNLLNLFLFVGILSWSFPVLSNDLTNLSNPKNVVNGYIVGNLMTSSGWYERYPNGQIVLYPIVTGSTISTTTNNMNSMPSMSSMYGMLGMGSMSGMNSMTGMAGMPSMTGMVGIPSMSGMVGFPSMGGMTAMYGMSAMSGMIGIASMYGIPPEGYQMTFGRFWIDKEGNLILYPSNNIFYMWGMNKTEEGNRREAMRSMKDNPEGMGITDSIENQP